MMETTWPVASTSRKRPSEDSDSEEELSKRRKRSWTVTRANPCGIFRPHNSCVIHHLQAMILARQGCDQIMHRPLSTRANTYSPDRSQWMSHSQSASAGKGKTVNIENDEISCEQYDTESLRKILASRIDANLRHKERTLNEYKNSLKDEDGNSVLHLAAEKGVVELLRLMLASGFDARAKNKRGQTPLHISVEKRFCAASNILLEASSWKDDQDEDGNSPLHIAAKLVNVSLMRKLLASGFSSNLKNRRGQTPLHVATEKGFPHTSDVLLKASSWNDDQDQDGNSPLHIAAKTGISFETAKQLLAAGFNSNLQNRRGQTPLHIAIGNGGCVGNFLIRAGYRNNLQDQDGNSPLHIAAEKGCFGMVRKLLALGVNGCLQNRKGKTPLHIALSLHGGDLEFLWVDGWENDLQDEDGKTPLHLAAEGWHPKSAQKLLFLGMHPHVKDNQGNYPLRNALLHADDDTVHRILSVIALQGIPIDWKAIYMGRHNIRRSMLRLLHQQEGCIAEIERMKNTTIHVNTVSYHDVARGSISTVARYLENERIRKVFQYDDALEDFPFYADMIAFKVMMAEKRRSRTIQCRKNFALLYRKVPSLPQISIDLILSYLSDRDIQNFAETFQSFR